MAKQQTVKRLVVPFHLKASADPASHTFEGLVAVIGQKDLGNDIIEPGAFKTTLGEWKASGDALPLLNSHDQYNIMSALGQLIEAKETKDGLWSKWEVIPGPEGDAVMARLTPSKVTGRPIVGKMSIGYIPVKWEIEQPDGTTSYWDQIRHLTEINWKEGSLVLFPMAPGAAIDASTVKSFLISAQATEAKSLDAVVKSELRRLATRIGILLKKQDDPSRTIAEPIEGKAEPAFAIGDRVVATVNHMPDMKGMAGAIAEAHAGSPPYYAVDFDEPMGTGNPHKWLTEDEIDAEETDGKSQRRSVGRKEEKKKVAMMTCPTCDSSGKMPDSTDTCTQCEGTGKVPKKAAKDDPEHPANDNADTDDDDLDVVADLTKDEAQDDDEEADDLETDQAHPPKKPKKADDLDLEIKAKAPYTYQEALTHRLQKTMLKHKVAAIGADE